METNNPPFTFILSPPTPAVTLPRTNVIRFEDEIEVGMKQSIDLYARIILKEEYARIIE